ncbi:MAG: enoyl-CoA hydratase/isomerase family protein, partial [Mycobacterium sp.]
MAGDGKLDGLHVELRDDGVGVITFDRPATLNSLTAKTLADLVDAFRQLDKDDGCGAVVVTGANGAFCTGMDLSGNALTEGGKELIHQVYEGMR